VHACSIQSRVARTPSASNETSRRGRWKSASSTPAGSSRRAASSPPKNPSAAALPARFTVAFAADAISPSA